MPAMISLTLTKSPRSASSNVELDDVVKLAAGCLRDRTQVLEHLLGLRVDALDQVAGRRVDPDLSGQVDGVAGTNRLRIGSERRRRVLAVDRLRCS